MLKVIFYCLNISTCPSPFSFFVFIYLLAPTSQRHLICPNNKSFSSADIKPGGSAGMYVTNKKKKQKQEKEKTKSSK
jgi:hypothetical protein